MALGWLVWTEWDEEDTLSTAAAGSAVLVTKLWPELTNSDKITPLKEVQFFPTVFMFPFRGVDLLAENKIPLKMAETAPVICLKTKVNSELPGTSKKYKKNL